MTTMASTSSLELKRFTSARRVAAFTFLAWAAGCAAMLAVQYALLSPGTPVLFLFSDESLRRSSSYLAGAGALALAAAAYLVIARAPSRKARWSLLALACVVVAVAFAFRDVHLASALGVVPVLWSLRFARMKLPQRPEAEAAPTR